MSRMREREGLIARIRQIRRTAAAAAPRSATAAATPRDTTARESTSALQALQARIEHLEQLVEALQDSVHRESERQGKRIAELEARTQPGALSVALSKDARDRGL
jgi:K+/H+ antiporter YhaU regulatory subunit KhtT